MNKSLNLIGTTIFLATLLLGCVPVSPETTSLQSTLIQDALLLEVWTQLYSLHEEVGLWDGSNISGRDLAQFVLDSAIPVVWDTECVCGGSSCSVRYFDGELWDFEDGQAGADPIYISPLLKDMAEGRLERLVDAMAHEIFHRTQPFGSGRDTQYEEFTAYYVGSHVAHTTSEVFTGYDGLNAASLGQWFIDNGLTAYSDLALYPQSVAALADNSTQVSAVDDRSTSQVVVQDNPTGLSSADVTSSQIITEGSSSDCQLNLEGWIECK